MTSLERGTELYAPRPCRWQPSPRHFHS